MHRLSSAFAVMLGALVGVGGASPPDVLVRVLPSATETWVGRAVVFNVVVSDVGGADASGVSVSVAVAGDARGKVVGSEQAVGSCSNPSPGAMTCTMDLQRAGTAVIRLQVEPMLPGSLVVSSHVAAEGDANGSNDDATASTIVHPGRQGPPALRPSGRPEGAIPDTRDERVAWVRGSFDVSEPGRLTVHVVDRADGAQLPVLAGSAVGSTKLTARRTTVTAPIGTAATTTVLRVVYDIRLPEARLRAHRVYQIVVRVVDLEGQEGNTLAIAFRLQPTT